MNPVTGPTGKPPTTPVTSVTPPPRGTSQSQSFSAFANSDAIGGYGPVREMFPNLLEDLSDTEYARHAGRR